VQHLGLDGHLALGGELHGVAAEVGENLAQAPGVGFDGGGQRRIDIECQLEAFAMCLERDHPRHVLDGAAQVGIDLLDVELARLDLGEIQNIVDHGEQRFAAFVNGSRVVALCMVERGIEQQFRHAQHTIDGRADLMTHVGQEFALRAVRSLGGLASRLHLGDHARAQGDVSADADQPGDAAAVIAHRNLAGQEVMRLARRIGHDLLAIDQRRAGADQCLLVFVKALGDLFWKQIEVVLAQQLIRRPAEVARDGGVRHQKAAVHVLGVDEVGNVIDHRAQQCAFARLAIIAPAPDRPQPGQQIDDRQAQSDG
jgi:hypothetical protein